MWDVFGKRGWEQLSLEEGPTLADPGVAVSIMQQVVNNYKNEIPATLTSISKSVGLSSSVTHMLLGRLLERGLLLYVTDGEKYIPAKPASEILLADALRVGFESCSAGLGNIDPALQELRQAQVQVLAKRTLSLPEAN